MLLWKSARAGNTKGGSITVPLTPCLTGLDLSVLQINKNCQLSHSWFQTSQSGGQWYSDTPPLVFPGRCQTLVEAVSKLYWIGQWSWIIDVAVFITIEFYGCNLYCAFDGWLAWNWHPFSSLFNICGQCLDTTLSLLSTNQNIFNEILQTV
jgi:hypothetical protein